MRRKNEYTWAQGTVWIQAQLTPSEPSSATADLQAQEQEIVFWVTENFRVVYNAASSQKKCAM